jgi:hypothetical protein
LLTPPGFAQEDALRSGSPTRIAKPESTLQSPSTSPRRGSEVTERPGVPSDGEVLAWLSAAKQYGSVRGPVADSNRRSIQKIRSRSRAFRASLDDFASHHPLVPGSSPGGPTIRSRAKGAYGGDQRIGIPWSGVRARPGEPNSGGRSRAIERSPERGLPCLRATETMGCPVDLVWSLLLFRHPDSLDQGKMPLDRLFCSLSR